MMRFLKFCRGVPIKNETTRAWIKEELLKRDVSQYILRFSRRKSTLQIETICPR